MVGKVTVLETLLDGESLVGVPIHHHAHEVAGVVTGVWNDALEADGRLLRPLEAEGGGQLEGLGPVGLARGPEHAADLLQLVVLGLAGEQRPQRVQLGHDAAHREDVDGRVLGRRAQQQFRRALPTG